MLAWKSWSRRAVVTPPDATVAAVMAVMPALRPGIWKIAEPSLIVSVWPASQARIVAASDP